MHLKSIIQSEIDQEIQILYDFSYAWNLNTYKYMCDPIDGSPPGSSVHGILQVRTLEWVAISSSDTHIILCTKYIKYI